MKKIKFCGYNFD